MVRISQSGTIIDMIGRIRAFIALLLIGSLLSLALYPLAFGVLMCRKVYGLAKTALLTRITDDRAAFLEADKAGDQAALKRMIAEFAADLAATH